MMFLSHNWYFSVQKALIYYTFNKSHHNSFILLVFSHVANFRYVANFRFLTLHQLLCTYHHRFCNNKSNTRDGSVLKLSTLGGRQCKTVPNLGVRVLVHPHQTWTHPVNDITINVTKYTKYEISMTVLLIVPPKSVNTQKYGVKAYNIFRLWVCF